jgi:membrane-associated phospholipid phosphatase
MTPVTPRPRRPLPLLVAAIAALSVMPNVQAGNGPLGIDHLITLDDHGIWSRRNQKLLFIGMVAGGAVGALWEGGDTRLGRTLWKSIDSTIAGGIAVEALKLGFARSRPKENPDPNKWFQGGGHASFPSGEVTLISAMVTPLVLEYRKDHPLVYALELLPLYDAIARVKTHGHWQSDVLAGYALGTATGYFMHKRMKTPVILGVLPRGFYVGLKHSFN